jgi:hypothetical protein
MGLVQQKKGSKSKLNKSHCVICHTDVGQKNKQCVVHHELYTDKDIIHKSKDSHSLGSAECWMVFCSYCNYKNCTANCEDFKDQPKECYCGEHFTTKEQAKEELLLLNRECTLCYPEELDMLDFIMNKVMFEEDNVSLKQEDQADKPAKGKGKGKGKADTTVSTKDKN